MSTNTTYLHEVAASSDAVKIARAEPIQQESTPKPTGFLRSLLQKEPVAESLNLEQQLLAQLESQVKLLSPPQDPKDQISFDVPLLIRVFELVREGIKSDVELHKLVERLISIRDKGVLTMDDYDTIAGGNPNGQEPDAESSSPAVHDANENLNSLKKLAGIK
jgi:hypothetical protein